MLSCSLCGAIIFFQQPVGLFSFWKASINTKNTSRAQSFFTCCGNCECLCGAQAHQSLSLSFYERNLCYCAWLFQLKPFACLCFKPLPKSTPLSTYHLPLFAASSVLLLLLRSVFLIFIDMCLFLSFCASFVSCFVQRVVTFVTVSHHMLCFILFCAQHHIFCFFFFFLLSDAKKHREVRRRLLGDDV